MSKITIAVLALLFAGLSAGFALCMSVVHYATWEFVPPDARIGSLQAERIRREFRLRRFGPRAAFGMVETDDDRLPPAVQIEVSNGETQTAAPPQAAEDPFKIPKAVDGDRLVGRPSEGSPDECGDGGGNTGDGANATRNLLDVNTWICR